MSIVEKKNNALATLETSPKIIPLNFLKTQNQAYKSLINVAKELSEIKEKNINLALKLNDVNKKYQQEKTEHRNTKRNLTRYHEENKELVFNLHCPYLNGTIDILQCNDSCNKGYCTPSYQCATRQKEIIIRYKLVIK